MSHASVRIKTEEPDFSALPKDPSTWDQCIYGTVGEAIPNDIPKLLGKFVAIIHCEDDNLFHAIMAGRSVTGILYLISKTLFDWYSKN